MRVYIKFLVNIFLKAFIYVCLIVLSLVIVLNLLTEIEFFRNLDVKSYIPLYISILNSPSLLFEMFPFIFLVGTQVFFINLFNNNQIQIFKYSGLKNSKILAIISTIAFFIGIVIITIFYNFSSNLKNIYLEIKNKYTGDNKYLAVITNNGLWMKDTVNGKNIIIHASKIDGNFLLNTSITELNGEFDVIKHVQSKKVNIKSKKWLASDAVIYEGNDGTPVKLLEIFSNFDYERIQSLFSNLSSLSVIELYNLKKNYEILNYSTVEVDIQIQKIISYPIYLTLMTFLSALIMFNTKKFKSATLKISIGLFLSVVIYYINNFFNVMGKTEKLSVMIAIWSPLFFLIITNMLLTFRINEK